MTEAYACQRFVHKLRLCTNEISVIVCRYLLIKQLNPGVKTIQLWGREFICSLYATQVQCTDDNSAQTTISSRARNAMRWSATSLDRDADWDIASASADRCLNLCIMQMCYRLWHGVNFFGWGVTHVLAVNTWYRLTVTFVSYIKSNM